MDFVGFRIHQSSHHPTCEMRKRTSQKSQMIKEMIAFNNKTWYVDNHQSHTLLLDSPLLLTIQNSTLDKPCSDKTLQWQENTPCLF